MPPLLASPAVSEGLKCEQDISLACDSTTSLEMIQDVWTKVDVINTTKSLELVKPFNPDVLLAMRNYPHSWNDSGSTLRPECAQNVALWWVAAVQLMRELGMNVAWVELFNEPKCGPPRSLIRLLERGFLMCVLLEIGLSPVLMLFRSMYTSVVC
jgi:hypothetical protein